MPGPIDISSHRSTSSSPSHISNLTNALRAANVNPVPAPPAAANHERERSNSTSTKGIAIEQRRPRRESTNAGTVGSMMGGMSWGGVSVGSWIRDDIIMTGSSPFTYQSPSYHSSSYMPKLEANFFRDFTCCGLTLPSLHELLEHYEECHAGAASLTENLSSQNGNLGGGGGNLSGGMGLLIQQQLAGSHSAGRPDGGSGSVSNNGRFQPAPHIERLQEQPEEDIDMELDEDEDGETTPPPQAQMLQPQSNHPSQQANAAHCS